LVRPETSISSFPVPENFLMVFPCRSRIVQSALPGVSRVTMLLAGLGIAYATTRKRATAPEAEALTEADRARLAELMNE